MTDEPIDHDHREPQADDEILDAQEAIEAMTLAADDDEQEEQL